MRSFHASTSFSARGRRFSALLSVLARGVHLGDRHEQGRCQAPPRGRRWDPHIASLVALVVGTALYVSTAIPWSLALVVVGVGCLLLELLHAYRVRMLLRNPPAPVQELPPRWRRAC